MTSAGSRLAITVRIGCGTRNLRAATRRSGRREGRGLRHGRCPTQAAPRRGAVGAARGGGQASGVGGGLSHAASAIAAQLCRGGELARVGGGNSAGLAAFCCAGSAAEVSLLRRGLDLGRNRSGGLVGRIGAPPKTVLRAETDLVEV